MSLTLEQQTVIRKQADLYGIPQAFVLGIIDKESAGNLFWKIGNQNVPAIRPEGHYFYKYLSGTARTKAIQMDLASPKQGGVHVPAKWSAVYAMFQRMIAIDRNAAMMSISMGVGQVMGANHEDCGYPDAESMWKRACSGIEGQVEIMLRFIAHNPKLLKAAQTFQYTTFAKIYNGPGYKRNRYDTELKQHVERWQGKREAVVTPTQDTIKKLGFPTVEAFQENYGLNPDGKIGPLTKNAVQEITRSIEANTWGPMKGAIATGGIGGVIGVATDGVDKLQNILDPVKHLLAQIQALGIGPNFLRTAAIMLVCGAIGFGVHYIWTLRKQQKIIDQE